MRTITRQQASTLTDPENIHLRGQVACLVHDAYSFYCRHSTCAYLNRHPINYFERRGEKIKQRRDFTYFEMHISHSKTRWLLPVNPYAKETPERNGFELFRQGTGEMQMTGRTPDGRERFHRDEISFKYISDYKGPWDIIERLKAVDIISDITVLYQGADNQDKRAIISTMYPGKLYFDGHEHRSTRMNEVVQCIYLPSSSLQVKKSRARTKKSALPTWVSATVLESYFFLTRKSAWIYAKLYLPLV